MHLPNYFPTPNNGGKSWDELHALVSRFVGEGTIVGHDGDGWLIAYLEGRHLPNQPDALVVYFSYAQDYSDFSIGAENFSGLGWLPNEPIDADWYESLPHPKKFTKHNSVQIDGNLIAYSYRGKQYHYSDVEIAAARKLKPCSNLHDLLEGYDCTVLKTAEGRASVCGKVADLVAQRLSVTDSSVVVTQSLDLEILVISNATSRSFTEAISLARLTQKTFEAAIETIDRRIQDHRVDALKP